MGESKRKRMVAVAAEAAVAGPQVVDTLGGRMHVRWDEHAAATPNGQLVFFAEFLAATGVFDRWVAACPLEYRSGNAPDKRKRRLNTLLTRAADQMSSTCRSSPKPTRQLVPSPVSMVAVRWLMRTMVPTTVLRYLSSKATFSPQRKSLRPGRGGAGGAGAAAGLAVGTGGSMAA